MWRYSEYQPLPLTIPIFYYFEGKVRMFRIWRAKVRASSGRSGDSGEGVQPVDDRLLRAICARARVILTFARAIFIPLRAIGPLRVRFLAPAPTIGPGIHCSRPKIAFLSWGK